jgi:hypothetical protein
MGYFSNGTEGEAYTARYCNQCEHDRIWREQEKDPCQVWNMHLIHNGAKGDLGEQLDQFIPRTKDGLGNEQCRMFVPVSRLKKTPLDSYARPKLIDWPKSGE